MLSGKGQLQNNPTTNTLCCRTGVAQEFLLVCLFGFKADLFVRLAEVKGKHQFDTSQDGPDVSRERSIYSLFQLNHHCYVTLALGWGG